MTKNKSNDTEQLVLGEEGNEFEYVLFTKMPSILKESFWSNGTIDGLFESLDVFHLLELNDPNNISINNVRTEIEK